MCWTPGMPKWFQTLVFYEGFEHTPVATEAFGTRLGRVSRSGAPVAASPQPQNTTENWPQSGRDLALVVGPPGPPEGARRGPGAPRGTRNTTDSADSRTTTKTQFFENVHLSREPGPFWPNRAPDRTPITTYNCVFLRGLKSGPWEPQKAEECTRMFFEGL